MINLASVQYIIIIWKYLSRETTFSRTAFPFMCIKMAAALAHLFTYKDKLVVILCYVIYVALNYAYNSYEFWQTNKQYNRADLSLPCPPIQHCNLLVLSSTSDTTFYVQVYKSCLIFNRLSFLRSGQCYM